MDNQQSTQKVSEPYDFSYRLKRALKEEKIRATHLAARVGVGRDYISHLVNRRRSNPSPDLLAKLAKELDVRTEWLLTGAEPMRPVLSAEARAALARSPRIPISAIGGNPDELIALMRGYLDALGNTQAREGREFYAKVILAAAELLNEIEGRK